MAMLAGPRKKTRYNLTPKGKPLFEDNDRFGTKMLEKMGWSKGKGLGKMEDGNQEFVRLKYKSDEQGLGFQERDDQWTEHEKQFNGLLENLNGEKKADSDECEVIRPAFGVPIVGKSTKKLKDKISGQSLEEKSKTSKARVHYKKFTKGKDMSQYSEKDLANIFGKKATPEDVNIYNQFQAFTVNANDDGEQKTEETPASDEKPELPLGTQVIYTGVSVNDYFKSKMAALKEKLGNRSSNPFDGNVRVINNVEVFVPSSKRKASIDEEQSATEECEAPRKKKKKSHEIEEAPAVVESSEPEKSQEEKISKKKKKKSKKESTEVDVIETRESLEIVSEVNNEEEVPKKKKKSKKKEVESRPTADDKSQDNNEDAVPKKKKSKKKEIESEPTADDENQPKSESLEIVSGKHNEEVVPKKKKKSEKRETESEPTSEDKNQLECNSEGLIPLKKKKSKKPSSEEAVEAASVPTSEEIPKKKKKKDSDESTPKENHHTELPTPTPETNSQQEDQQQQQTKPPSKSKSKQKKPETAEVSAPQPILETTYKLSTFCAEKFRVIELHQFKDSNLSNIIGYGLSENLKLDIKENPKDLERITRLWNGTIDKYTHANAKHKVYCHFMDKVKLAQMSQCQIPQFKLRNLKRKQVFQCV